MVSTSAETEKDPAQDLPPGTTPYYANMHKWIKRAVLVCLVALVVEGRHQRASRGVAQPLPLARAGAGDGGE